MDFEDIAELERKDRQEEENRLASLIRVLYKLNLHDKQHPMGLFSALSDAIKIMRSYYDGHKT